ncbi:LCP family protein [Sinomonas albida]|uniref:LCP family protein n=1 Tax=Sinomonas albida TaxID=369942 RepID=UPI00301B0438
MPQTFPTGPRRLRRLRRRRSGRIALGAAALAVVLAAGAAFAYVATLSTTFDGRTGKIATAFPDESTRPSSAPAANGKTPLNILLVGSDSRGATAQQAEAGDASDQRSDTLMLVHVPADRAKAYVVSIMRDLWVPIPGHGSAKINAALAWGGEPLLVQTVEALLRQRIDHVVLLDFAGFKGLTDAVGGVDVDVPIAFTPVMFPGFRFEKGPRHLDGEAAFAFVRERYAFPDGDFQRVRNQQIYLKSLLRKVAAPQTLANPVALASAVNELSPYLTVDATLTASAVAGLGFELKDVRPEDVVMFTLPTKGTGWSADRQSIVLLDQDAVTGLADAMAKGTMGDFVASRR